MGWSVWTGEVCRCCGYWHRRQGDDEPRRTLITLRRRPSPDAYDADYDKGRLKKTKKKAAAGEREAGASTSKLFDAFQKTVKKGKNLVANVGKKVSALGGGGGTPKKKYR